MHLDLMWLLHFHRLCVCACAGVFVSYACAVVWWFLVGVAAPFSMFVIVRCHHVDQSTLTIPSETTDGNSPQDTW